MRVAKDLLSVPHTCLLRSDNRDRCRRHLPDREQVMARRVFFSFKYEDVSRAMVVRNSWVTQGKEAAGFIDAADFEALKRRGDEAIQNWIDSQLKGTSVTVVLIGEETCGSRWVKYEIEK